MVTINKPVTWQSSFNASHRFNVYAHVHSEVMRPAEGRGSGMLSNHHHVTILNERGGVLFCGTAPSWFIDELIEAYPHADSVRIVSVFHSEVRERRKRKGKFRVIEFVEYEHHVQH